MNLVIDAHPQVPNLNVGLSLGTGQLSCPTDTHRHMTLRAMARHIVKHAVHPISQTGVRQCPGSFPFLAKIPNYAAQA